MRTQIVHTDGRRQPDEVISRTDSASRRVTIRRPTAAVEMAVGSLAGAGAFLVGIAAILRSDASAFDRTPVEVLGMAISALAGTAAAAMGAVILAMALAGLARTTTFLIAVGALSGWILTLSASARSEVGVGFGWSMWLAATFTVAAVVLGWLTSSRTVESVRVDEEIATYER